MKFTRILQTTRVSLPEKSKGRVLTLGSFDGLHLGHQKVIKEVVRLSTELGLAPSLLSFYPHPSVRLKRAVGIPKITTLRQRMALLSKIGIEEFFLLNFTSHIAVLEWQEFCKKVLIEQLNVKCLVLGADARIGKGAKGTPEVIRPFMEALGITVVTADLDVDNVGIKFSSRHIRDDISSANLREIKLCLGRNFEINGTVVSGQKIGRTLGFPTANIFASRMVSLPNGVYAVRIRVPNNPNSFTGVMNIGVRPTVSKTKSMPTTEVHIFNFNQDIYRKKISIEVIERIRDECRFDSVEKLREQIERDCLSAKQILEADKQRS